MIIPKPLAGAFGTGTCGLAGDPEVQMSFRTQSGG
jgi:hypothetical protein